MKSKPFPGAEFSIVRSRRKTIAIQVKPGKIIVRAPLKMRDADIYRFVEQKRAWAEKHLASLNNISRVQNEEKPFTEAELKALKAKAAAIMSEKVRIYAAMMGVDYGRITIRCQRTRWGSCSGRGNLNFNCLLALMPEEIIDSIVVHELCHRKHMDHSAAFYAEYGRYFPDYKKSRAWLKENGRAYLARLPEKE